MLSESQIAKFQQIYKKVFNREISRDEALEKGVRLIRQIALLYRLNIDNKFLDASQLQKGEK